MYGCTNTMESQIYVNIKTNETAVKYKQSYCMSVKCKNYNVDNII